MKQLVILSGKGGTGKTTVASTFIELSNNKAYADCDVDAPNLHLIHAQDVKPVTEDFYGYKKAVKYNEYCIECGKCEELCRFGAIRNGILNPYDCEGCGVCEEFCSAVDDYGKKAIRLEKNISGKTMLYKDEKQTEIFSSAELRMGNGASGKLVTEVRKNLYNAMNGQELVIIDGSPGIGCPVIASVTGVDMVLVVAEPTLSGIHDMERIVDTAAKFGALCAICINKYDINPENAQLIEEYCIKHSISMVGKIPFDPLVIEGVNNGKSLVTFDKSPAKEAIQNMWMILTSILFDNKK